MSLYSVAELSRQTGLTTHTLRYYEKEALLLDVSRDPGGRRQYSEEHLYAVKFISALRATGMPIRLIKQYIQLYRDGSETGDQRLELLLQHEKKVIGKLLETENSLQLIRKKIQYYKDNLGQEPAEKTR